MLAAIGFIAGTFVMVMSNSLSLLLVGRTLVGFGVGIGLAVDPIYIAEVTPASYRGELVTWSEVALNVGATLGFSSGWILSDLDDGVEWRAMLLMGAIMPTIMIIVCLTSMPESPRWLIAKRRIKEARQVLTKMYPANYDIDDVLEEIKQADKRDRKTSMTVGWSFIYEPSPAVRRMLLVGVGAAVCQQLVGIDAIQYYLADVVANSGIQTKREQSLILMTLGLIKLLFVLVGGKTFDRAGRRVGLSISLIGMACSLVLVGASFSFQGSSWATVAVLFGICGYLSFFSVGIGPGAWLIPSEVFPNLIRGKAMSVATAASRIVATVMATTFLTIADGVGWGAMFCSLAGICLLICAYFLAFLPETKGRSLEEMSLYFAEVTGDHSLLHAEAELQKLRKDSSLYTDDSDSCSMSS